APSPDDAAKSEAEKIAEKFLKAGSDLFDAKDAAALASTYTPDATIHLISKKDDGQLQDDVKRGQSEIEGFYRSYFKEVGTIDSENFLEFAKLLTPDVIVAHGRFRLDVGKEEVPFVQMRSKQGDKWAIYKLLLFLGGPHGK